MAPSYRKAQWERWGLRPPPFPVGFAVGGGRVDPQNRRFPARPAPGDKDNSWSSQDKNEDGLVVASELQDGLKTIGASDEAIAAIFREADVNGLWRPIDGQTYRRANPAKPVNYRVLWGLPVDWSARR